MELIFLIGLAVSILVIILTIAWQKSRSKSDEKPSVQQREAQVGAPQRLQAGVPLRAQIARNQRARNARASAAAAAVEQENGPAGGSDDDSDDGGGDDRRTAARLLASDEKIGAKKRAKLEAKAEKKVQREAELQFREDKKEREAQLDEEKRKIEEKEKQEELKREEAERIARELKEKQEYEEYLQMKAAFSIDEEGFDETETTENENLLQEFINYVKDKKVVLLEDLAREFKLKTQAALDRLNELKENGTITGVLDDRGKFIYISEDELKDVAKFIRQRGRISISELAESSNNLINLTTPVLSTS